MSIRLWLGLLMLSVLGVGAAPARAADDRVVGGLAQVGDILLDIKDPDPSPRIVAMLAESALTIDPKLSGSEYVRTKLPGIFARQMGQARQRQSDSPFRDPNMRLFGIAPNPESLMAVEQQVVTVFSGLNKFPRQRLAEAFARVQHLTIESGEVFGLYDAQHRDVPTVLLLMIFNHAGRIVLIDEL